MASWQLSFGPALNPKCARVGVGTRVVTGHRHGKGLSVHGDGEIQLVSS